MSKDIVQVEYDQSLMSFNENGWFNATAAAEKFGKRPAEWLRLPDTEKYIDALCDISKVGKSHFVKTSRGGDPSKSKRGTWLHPKLAVLFARWLDVRFAVWCDDQIDRLVRGEHEHFDWKKLRAEATSSYKVMNAVMQVQRQVLGKATAPHHYSNEARLINWALSGEFKSVDRDSLTAEELELMAKLEVTNTVMLSSGLPYALRKEALEITALQFRVKLLSTS